jgi:hypothetical protein
MRAHRILAEAAHPTHADLFDRFPQLGKPGEKRYGRNTEHTG